MTSEQNQVREWMQAYGQDTPTTPTIPSLEVRKLRAKLILEEALETTKALGLFVEDRDSGFEIEMIGLDIKEAVRKEVNLAEILDGCEDLKVVTEGTLVACGLLNPKTTIETWEPYYGPPKDREIPDGIDPHFNEVMRSNWTKLWTNEEVYSSYNKSTEQKGIRGTGTWYYWDNLTASKHIATPNTTDRCWLVKDSSGKVIKSPSADKPQFKL